MGIHSRDYYRDATSSGPGWLSDCPAVKWLIVVTCVVFVLQLVFTTPGEMTPFGRAHGQSLIDQWFQVDPVAVAHGQVWRLITNAFLHSRYDPLHLLFNMLTLWWFGRTIEELYGSREFTWFYLTAAFIGGVGFTLWGWLLHDPTPGIGASGAVMAVLMLYARHYPKNKVYIFGIIGIEAQWLVALYAFFDLYPALVELSGGGMGDGIAHIVHLSGLAFGWIYYRQGWRLASGWDRLFGRLSFSWRRNASGRNLKVYQPVDEPVDLEAEVDRILAKIHEQGSESLSARERSLLTRASERYKKRD